jgi:hypothetical protein
MHDVMLMVLLATLLLLYLQQLELLQMTLPQPSTTS